MLARIRNLQNSLPPSGKKIAAVILENPRAVPEMDVRVLADAAGVAPSAVIRFCQSLGLEGFPALKLRLTESLSRTEEWSELPALQPGATPKDVFPNVFGSGIRALEDTLRLIDMKTVDEICTLFRSAKRIVFFGVGTSSVVAIDAHYRLTQLGLPAYSCTDIVFMNVTALNMGEGDVAVGISHSGNTTATLETLQRAKEAGAKTVAITSFEEGKLAKLCDYTVVAFADDRQYPVEAVSARLAHFCIMDAFMMTLATMDYESLPAHIQGRNDVLKQIRGEEKK